MQVVGVDGVVGTNSPLISLEPSLFAVVVEAREHGRPHEIFECH